MTKQTRSETLADLIRSRRGRQTYGDLAKRTEGIICESRWQQIGRGLARGDGSPTMPTKPDAIGAIADALEVSVDRVWRSMAVSQGLPLAEEESRLLARMPAGTSHLSDRSTDAVLEVIDVLVRSAKDGL